MKPPAHDDPAEPTEPAEPMTERGDSPGPGNSQELVGTSAAISSTRLPGSPQRVEVPEPAELAELAVHLAHRAGALVLRGRAEAGPDGLGRDLSGRLRVATKSTPTDVVTEMDRAAERLVGSELAVRRPQDAVLGEEGASRAGSSGVRWVVDPIDGTVNYLYGIPMYAVSVAAEVDGQVVAGAVYNPVSGETFRAVRGGGAWLGDQRLGGPGATSLGQSLVGTGFAYDAAVRAEQAQVIARLLPVVRDVRRMGAASLDLCYAAAGRLDAYFERGLQPWDHAAGGLVAAEAGLVVHGLRGRPAGPWFVLAAGAGIAEELTTVLEALDADGTGAH